MFSSIGDVAQNRDRTDILGFLAGKHEALDSLLLRHKDRVFNLCYRVVGDTNDAEECAQEIFIPVPKDI